MTSITCLLLCRRSLAERRERAGESPVVIGSQSTCTSSSFPNSPPMPADIAS